MKENSNKPSCNFCGKTITQVDKLLTGDTEDIAICNVCVEFSHEVLKKQNKFKKVTAHKISPKQLHRDLDEYVIGQDNVKKSISVAVRNHFKRLSYSGATKLQKSNVLLVGPTGVGKTLIAQTLANIMSVPFVITDATTITESGYAGDDAEVLIHHLVQNADYDQTKAEMGIIYVDEIDKKAKRNDLVSLSRDVSGEGVQQSLLKLMEGTTIKVPNKPNSNPEYIEIDTTNILFIVGGAFVGLDQQVQQRLGKSKIGFNEVKQDQYAWEKHLETSDLVQYGLIPEFLGRLPSVNILRELTEDELVRIMTEPKNCITDQYKILFTLDKIDLEFTMESVKAVAKIAIAQNLGARGLRKILDDALTEVQYQLPELANSGVTKIVITPDVINRGKMPLMSKGGQN